MLYSGKTLLVTIAHRPIQTKQYSHFTIRVAGHNTTINTGVISGLQTILLGREWIRSVHLLSDAGNETYYIPAPLAVDITREKFPDIFDTEVETRDVKPVETATFDEIAEEHDDDDFRKTDCSDDHSSNGRSSPDDDPYSESEPSFDGQNLLDGDTPSDEPSSGDDPLYDGGTPSEGPGEREVRPTDDDGEDAGEDDEEGGDDDGNDDHEDYGDDDGGDDGDDVFSEDYEDYKCHEGKVCDECDGYEEYEGFGEGEKDPDDNLLEQYIDLERVADAEHTKEPHRQQSESKDEPALPSSHHTVRHEQSAILDPARYQVNGVQSRITKRQSKEIANILNHISRTPAGQSFRHPSPP